jgi:hypothetical protein
MSPAVRRQARHCAEALSLQVVLLRPSGRAIGRATAGSNVGAFRRHGSTQVVRKGRQNMDQLVNEISTRTGITQDQARQAVQMAVDFVKQKLPPALASQVDGFLGGTNSGDMAQQAQQALGGLGDMFGKK